VAIPPRLEPTARQAGRLARRFAVQRWMSSGSSPNVLLFVIRPFMPPPRWAVEAADLAPLGSLFPQPRRRPLHPVAIIS